MSKQRGKQQASSINGQVNEISCEQTAKLYRLQDLRLVRHFNSAYFYWEKM